MGCGTGAFWDLCNSLKKRPVPNQNKNTWTTYIHIGTRCTFLTMITSINAPYMGPGMRTFDVVFIFSPNKLLNKQSSCQWFYTPLRSCDVTVTLFCRCTNSTRPGTSAELRSVTAEIDPLVIPGELHILVNNVISHYDTFPEPSQVAIGSTLIR